MNLHTLYAIVHLFGVAMGAGGAFLSDLLFMSSIKDGRISPAETRSLKIGSAFVWIGLAVLLASGIGLFSSNPERYLASPKFLAKMTLVGIIVINGLFFHFSHIPRIVRHQGARLPDSREFMRTAPLLFASGAVSLVSWSGALILGALRVVPWSYAEIMLAYLAVVVAAVFIAIEVGRHSLPFRRN